jgi:hypothetical protein
MHNNSIKATGNKPLWFLQWPVAPRLISGVMMNKIDKIKKIADIKIEKRGKKWLVN